MTHAKPEPPFRPVREPKGMGVAMVGHAFMGRAHANALRQVNRFFDLPLQVLPRVVVGRDRARAAAMAEKLGFAEASADLATVLARDDVHIVDVATPNDSHHEIAMAALAAGKHVLCEKPLAMTVAEAEAMVAAARRAGVRVGVWHNYRRCPAASLAQRLVERGELGVVRQVRATYLQDWLASADTPASWRTERRRCGSGAHGDLNAHLIDMTRFVTGLEFAEVCGMEQTFTPTRTTPDGRAVRVDVDDAFAFLARFTNGAIGTYEATRTAPGRKNWHQLEVHGATGSLLWNLERMNEVQVFRYDEPADARGYRTVMCMDPVHPYAAHWWPDGHVLGYEHTFVHTLADFLLALHDGSPFAPDFADGLAVQRVLDAAARSARERHWVEVGTRGKEAAR
ncbi:MAG: Gfo/Idh/MocA family oxidoreductase [Planctomycetes bacterium]|nr:Gfo/Idh/MocA family oxidoreductase [Planctomycetota bacterium]